MPVTSGVSQDSVLGPVLFVIDINDNYLQLNNFISKFADDTRIGNTALTEQDRRSLQGDLCKLSDWSEEWEMPFNINNCQILQQLLKTKMDCEMCCAKIKSLQLVKDLGETVSSNLKLPQQCNEAVKQANRMLGLIKRVYHSGIKTLYYLYITALLDLIWSMPCSFHLLIT